MFETPEIEVTEDSRYDVVAFSGGKDSLATLLTAIEREIGFVTVFADTGNEHPLTYEYVDYVERALGIEILRVKADFSARIAKKREYIEKKWESELIVSRWGEKKSRRALSKIEIAEALDALHPTGNPFLDLILQKGMMPTPRQKFCSMELKQMPMFEQVYEPAMALGLTPICWQGVRAQESAARSRYEPVEETADGLILYRPLLMATHEEVLSLAKRHGVKHNPLYQQGMARVGCMPCINCSNRELAEIGRRFPEEINRIAKWEKLVAKTTRNPESRESGVVSFFPFKKKEQDPHFTAHDAVALASSKKGFQEWKNSEWFDDDADPDVCSAVYPIVCE